MSKTRGSKRHQNRTVITLTGNQITALLNLTVDSHDERLVPVHEQLMKALIRIQTKHAEGREEAQ